jgi:hypothetical protein
MPGRLDGNDLVSLRKLPAGTNQFLDLRPSQQQGLQRRRKLWLILLFNAVI